MDLKRFTNLKTAMVLGAALLAAIGLYSWFATEPVSKLATQSQNSKKSPTPKKPGDKVVGKLEILPDVDKAKPEAGQKGEVYKPIPKTDGSEMSLHDLGQQNIPSLKPGETFAALPKSQGSGSIKGSKEIGWDDLVPKSLTVEKMEDLMGKAAQYTGVDTVHFDPKFFPAVKKLDGKKVSIPGFMVAMDFDAKSVKEFLLVPYMGACVHTPPPPPNQIIYVKMAKGVKPLPLNEPITMTGILQTRTKKSELANAVYIMDGQLISEYKEE